MKTNKEQFNTRLSKKTIETLRKFEEYKQKNMASFIEKAVENYKQKILEGKK